MTVRMMTRNRDAEIDEVFIRMRVQNAWDYRKMSVKNKERKLMNVKNKITIYQSMITDIKQIILSGQKYAYYAANEAVVRTYWHVGKRIVEQEQNGEARAEYGSGLIEKLAEELTKEYGKNYSKRNLQYFRKFYLAFPDEEIVNTCVHNLN